MAENLRIQILKNIGIAAFAAFSERCSVYSHGTVVRKLSKDEHYQIVCWAVAQERSLKTFGKNRYKNTTKCSGFNFFSRELSIISSNLTYLLAMDSGNAFGCELRDLLSLYWGLPFFFFFPPPLPGFTVLDSQWNALLADRNQWSSNSYLHLWKLNFTGGFWKVMENDSSRFDNCLKLRISLPKAYQLALYFFNLILKLLHWA